MFLLIETFPNTSSKKTTDFGDGWTHGSDDILMATNLNLKYIDYFCSSIAYGLECVLR